MATLQQVRVQDGPIDAPKTVAHVRQEPYNLPERCASPSAMRRACLIVGPGTVAPQDWLRHLFTQGKNNGSTVIQLCVVHLRCQRHQDGGRGETLTKFISS